MQMKRPVVFAALFAVIALASYSITRAGTTRTPARVSASAAKDTIPVTVAESLAREGYPTGRHLVVYFLYSADCGFCKMPTTVAAIRRLRAGVRANARKAGFASATVVAVSPDVERAKSLAYLDRIGAENLDEVSIGGGWLNEHIARLVWRDTTVAAAVPQLLIVTREVGGTMTPFRLSVGADSVLAVVSNQPDILRWDSAGFSIDYLLRARRVAAR